MNVANLAGSAVSIAVEFALQLIDFDDTTSHLAGWVAVGLLAALGLIGYLRRRRSLPGVLKSALELGKEMRNYIRMRESNAPPSRSFEGRSMLSFWHGREPHGGGHASRDTYDSQTMSIWNGRFAKKLSATLAKLHSADCIDLAELNSLLAPETPTEVERLASRLIDLGCQET